LNKIALITLAIVIAGGLYTVRDLAHNNDRPPKEVVEMGTPSNVISEKSLNMDELQIGEAILTIEVADSPQERMQGLSGRKSLAQDEGLIFLFEDPLVSSFWMKDMLFPIDIIWISGEGTVVGFEEEVDPSTFPKTFSPKEPVKYVLEVNSGWVRANNVQVGDAVIGSVIK